MRKIVLSVLAALCFPACAAALPLESSDIAAMVQECPSLDEYKNDPAVIWSRKQLYTQDSRRRTVKTTSYVILCGASAKLDWLESQMIAPAGGSVELEQAAIFDPGTSKLVQNIPVDRDELAHGRIVLKPQPLPDEYVFVLSYRQTFPDPDVMEDIAWISTDFPTWEGSVQVRIDKNQELLYESGTNAEPTIDADNNFRRYGWFYFKQPATRGMRGMVDSSDPYVMFSLQRGPASEIAMMNDLASRKWGPIPAEYVEAGTGTEADLKTVARFWRSKSRIRAAGIWRSADAVPAEGPWTTWEAAYVAAQWLQQRGWKAEVWFQHVTPQTKESLSCPEAFQSPTLLLTEPKGRKAWYFVPGQPVEPGKVPVTLRGKALYAAGAKRLRKRSVGGSRLEKNRLSIFWKLNVAADCTVSGTLDLRIRNSWVDQFDGLDSWDKDRVLTLLDGLEGWVDLNEEPKVDSLGGQGVRIVMNVRARSGIQAPQGGLLIGLPSVIPGPLLRLHDISSSAVLKFPFVVTQDYSVNLPSEYRALSTPYKQDQGSYVSSYSSQYRINTRKNDLEGGEKLLQNGIRVDADALPGFKRIIEMWGTWRSANLTLVPTRH